MWVKICGVTEPDVGAEIAALQPDAIGLNFYSRSPRCVDVDVAAAIVRQTSPDVATVGLFVDQSVDEIQAIVARCPVSIAQLHGDQDARFVAALTKCCPSLPLVIAYRMGEDGLEPLRQLLNECDSLHVRPFACLVDARVPGKFGGSGATVDWNRVAVEYRRELWPPMILAGGLDPGNVAEAIRVAGPWGVDVASGVEESPGKQSVSRVAEFLSAARDNRSAQ